MFGFLRSLFSRRPRPEPLPPPRFGTADLARRLGLDPAELRHIEIAYTLFHIPKRRGGLRKIHAPIRPLKEIQRRILHRLLRRLRAHPNATGFERGHSIVTNALPHTGKDVVIRLDLVDFFASTPAERVNRYFRFIGYDPETADLLTRLCTHNGCLPQGAPTSPRLSNLVNYRLDARLVALADQRGMSYTRYADDITFSGSAVGMRPTMRMNPKTLETFPREFSRVNDVVRAAKRIIEDEGYRLHMHRKLRVYRRRHRQLVTGLVVNDRPNLPRTVRHRLRAVEHHLKCGRSATLTPEQLAGWKAMQSMIATQTEPEWRN